MADLVSPGDLNVRQKFVNLLPALVAIAFVGILVMAGAPDQPPDVHRLIRRAEDYGWVGIAALTSGSLILALLLEPLEIATIRFLEGYWSVTGPLARLTDSAVWMQQRRKDRWTWVAKNARDTAARERAREELQRIPRDQPLLPTGLGNRLRGMEERAGEPYHLHAILAWPRLYYALPEQALKVVAESRNQLDTAARLSLTFVILAFVSAGLLVRHEWWLTMTPALLVMGWFAYRAAVAAAGVYSAAVYAAFDVHRLTLLQMMRLDMPTTLLEERALNEKLTSIWLRRTRSRPAISYSRTDQDVGLFHQ